jgi:hypothetical protein
MMEAVRTGAIETRTLYNRRDKRNASVSAEL